MFRREWRQQVLVLALLASGVAAAIGFGSVAYNVAPAPGNKTFGTADHSLLFEGLDSRAIQANLTAAEDWFGVVEVIGHRQVPVPGGFQPVEYRAQDPHGPYGGPRLSLRQGRYPGSAGEVAVTDAVAEAHQLSVGATLCPRRHASHRVGMVENPSGLDDEFALVRPAPMVRRSR
jgi:putative ABC transport system permease protein